MSPFLYELSLAYIRAYHRYMKIYDELKQKAIHGNGIDYSKTKVNFVPGSNENRYLEHITLKEAIEKSFRPIIKALSEYDENLGQAILKNISGIESNIIFKVGYKEFYEYKILFIKKVAENITSEELMKFDKKYLDNKNWENKVKERNHENYSYSI